MISKRFIVVLPLLVLITAFSFSVGVTHAATGADLLTGGLNAAAGTTYDKNLNLPVLIGNLIKVLLSATGMLFLGIAVYAGILYNISLGNDDKVKTAKKMLAYSVIGLVIIIGAYALADFVIEALATASTSEGSGVKKP